MSNMKKEPKKKPTRKRREPGPADAKSEDFEAMTGAQLGASLRNAVIPTKGGK
jgi:hypothetical protein